MKEHGHSNEQEIETIRKINILPPIYSISHMDEN